MAIGNLVLTNVGKEALVADNANQINWTGGTVKAVLLTAAYTPDTAHSTFADISANEITDVGYAQAALTNKTCVRTANKVLWDCDNISFGTNVSLTAKYLALVYQAGGSVAAGDLYIGYIDLNVGAGLSATSSNASFGVNTPNGLFDI
jgi:hypothetical protein